MESVERWAFVMVAPAILLFVPRNLTQLITRMIFKRGDRVESNAELEQAYKAARPMIPEPNELIELSRSTGKTLEEVSFWFRNRRAIDRTELKANSISECVWRVLIFSSCLFLSLYPDAIQSKSEGHLIRTSLQTHLVLIQIFSWGTMPVNEYLLVLAESVNRLCLVSFFGLPLSILTGQMHDSVDLFFEVSKVVDATGLVGAAKILYFAFFVFWLYFRLVSFPWKLFQSTMIEDNLALALIMVQLLFDWIGFYSVFLTVRTAFWSATITPRRVNRGDSLSSATSMDYESDSSLSSNLKGEKDD